MSGSTDQNQKRVWTIPNLLSLLRIALVPLIVWLYIGRRNYALALAMLLLSGLTDLADGYIARKFSMDSDLGKVLDPVADKLTQAAMLGCLVLRYPHIWALLILLAVKELAIGLTGLNSIRITGTVQGSAWHGKLTTAALYGTLGLHMIWFSIPQWLSVALVIVCAALMLLTMFLYVKRNLDSIKRDKER